MRLNLSTNGDALADPEYVRMVAPQFEPRKKVANFWLLRSFSSIRVNFKTRYYIQMDFIVAVYVILLVYRFSGKVGSDLGEENPITPIRWTTQFVRVRRISDFYNPT